MATNPKVAERHTHENKNTESAATIFFLAVEIKTNFDLFHSEPDEDSKARILPLISFVVSRPHPMAPLLLKDGPRASP